MAWEQVILTAYAMPSRKYRFQTMSWSPRSRKIERHILTPNQFNFIIIAGVLFPFVVPVISGIPAIKSFARANTQWKVFDTNCHDFIHFLKNTSVPLDSTNNILKNTKETQMLLQLLELSNLGDKIAVYNRWTGGLYFFVAFIQTFMGSILQISILRCLFSRLKVLRDRCIQWQKLRLELPVSNSEVSFSIFKESIHGGQDNGTIDLKDRPVESWTDWLPRYTSASGNGSQSISHPIDEKELFEGTSDGRTLQQQYIITRVYTINFTWVAVLMLFAMLSTMLCALASALNWYDSPKKRTYLQALVFQIMWTNATWGGGSGILQGILKIMITSSPVPVLPREPSAAPITHSDEE